MATQIGRLLTAMVTPFDDQGKVDYAQARRLARALIASGSDGVVVSGTTGESPCLTHDEKVRLFAEIKEELGAGASVVAGTGNYSTQESIELSREAEHAGADGLLLTVPYYNKPTQEGLYQHFKAIAASTHLPCVLYNVPSRTVTDMSPDTTIRLSHVDNICGIKEATGNLETIARIIDGSRDGFLVWSGNDSDTFHVMTLGGYGVVSVAAHLIGLQIKRMMTMVLEGDTRGAAKEHMRQMPLVKALFIVSNPIPVKYAVNRAGLEVGQPRLPLLPPDEATAKRIDEVLAKCHVDLPVGAAR